MPRNQGPAVHTQSAAGRKPSSFEPSSFGAERLYATVPGSLTCHNATADNPTRYVVRDDVRFAVDVARKCILGNGCHGVLGVPEPFPETYFMATLLHGIRPRPGTSTDPIQTL
jgi:hypothetical protein